MSSTEREVHAPMDEEEFATIRGGGPSTAPLSRHMTATTTPRDRTVAGDASVVNTGTTSRRFSGTVSPSSGNRRQSVKRRKSSMMHHKNRHIVEGIHESAEDYGESLLEQFAPQAMKSGSGSDSVEPMCRWASKFSPLHMYCCMKGYEDILDEIYGNVVDETGRKPKFSPGRDNMVIASMKHQQDAAYVTQVSEKQMTKISAKFTAAMRLLDAHKETLDQPHTSRQPIMVGRPHDVYLAWLHSWTDEFNFRLKTTRETSSVIDEINEEFLK